jgi:hypothetical protein
VAARVADLPGAAFNAFAAGLCDDSLRDADALDAGPAFAVVGDLMPALVFDDFFAAVLAPGRAAFEAVELEDFFRVCLDIRLPFVAFGRSIISLLRTSWQGCRCWEVRRAQGMVIRDSSGH